MKNFQEKIDQWMSGYKDGYWPAHEQFARLAEEVGEVGRALNIKYGHKNLKPGENPDSLTEELGDILFCVASLANSEKIDLEVAMQIALDKCHTRDVDRFEKK